MRIRRTWPRHCSFLATLLITAGTISHPAVGAVLPVPTVSYPNIMSAMLAAADGDTIQVQPGFYLELIDFLGKAVTLESTGGAAVTFLQSPSSSSPGSVITCRSGEGSNTVLNGFHISNGGGTTTPAGGGGRYGLGMYNANSSPLIMNCVFMDLADPGDEIYGGAMANLNSSPKIVDCVFQENQAWRGAGIYNRDGSQPEIDSCLFLYNATYSLPGGTPMAGAGGAIYSELGSAPRVTNSEFRLNFANPTGAGGAVYSTGSATDVSNGYFANCLFVFNQAQHAAGIWNSGGQITVTNCTFAENQDTAAPYATCIYSVGVVTATNCIFYDNGPTNVPLDGSTSLISVSWSDVEGGWPGLQNFDLPPIFTATFGLGAGSPCIDSGDDFADIDASTLALDTIPLVDLASSPRFMDEPATPNTGVGEPPVDRGCFERDGIPGIPYSAMATRGDDNGDGAVNIADPIFNLAYLFTGGPSFCLDAQDSNDDGLLNIADPIFHLSFLFTGGAHPPDPVVPCGTDPTTDALGCADSSCP
ncbi:MAG: right-handed parallel beta-helix repeat-containing protein [Planctomycetota bacterium]